jgi:hypothetical protein
VLSGEAGATWAEDLLADAALVLSRMALTAGSGLTPLPSTRNSCMEAAGKALAGELNSPKATSTGSDKRLFMLGGRSQVRSAALFCLPDLGTGVEEDRRALPDVP